MEKLKIKSWMFFCQNRKLISIWYNDLLIHQRTVTLYFGSLNQGRKSGEH